MMLGGIDLVSTLSYDFMGVEDDCDSELPEEVF